MLPFGGIPVVRAGCPALVAWFRAGQGLHSSQYMGSSFTFLPTGVSSDWWPQTSQR
jgi:hypothetical protein